MKRQQTIILVTGIGGDLGQAVAKSLRLMPGGAFIIGCDMDPQGAGPAFADRFEPLPSASDPGFGEQVAAICRRHGVQAVVPGCVPDMEALPGLFPGRVMPDKTPIVCQDLDWFQRFDDKLSTYEFFKDSVPLARYCDDSNPDAVERIIQEGALPCMVKPRRSSGSRNLTLARSREELVAALDRVPDAVVQEYIDDEHGEFSVGVYRQGGECRTIAFRRTFGGSGGASWYADNHAQPAEVLDYARRMAEASGLQGSCNIQVRFSSRGVLLLEVNPRFSSLAAARAAAGFRDVEWALTAALGRPVEPLPDAFRPLRFQRFFHEVVDLGDGYRRVEEWGPLSTSLSGEE